MTWFFAASLLLSTHMARGSHNDAHNDPCSDSSHPLVAVGSVDESGNYYMHFSGGISSGPFSRAVYLSYMMGISEPEPASSPTPNYDLLRELKGRTIQICHNAIEALQSDRYKGLMVDNTGYQETFISILNYLEKLPDPIEKFISFSKQIGAIQRSLDLKNSFLSDRCFFGHSFHRGNWAWAQSSESISHEMDGTVLRNETMKAVDAYLHKIMYLCDPLKSRTYLPIEDDNEGDVTENYLPSTPQVEEGLATIQQEENHMFIHVLEPDTIITFDNFWIGKNAQVSLSMENDDCSVHIYQLSGKKSYILGSFNRGQKGSVSLYSPRGQIIRGAFSFFRMSMSGGVEYQPKNSRRYHEDLSAYPTSKPDPETIIGSIPSPTYHETPEGRLELALLPHKKAMELISEESLGTCNAFLKTCEEHGSLVMAKRLSAVVERNMAFYYHEKAKSLPFEGQQEAYKQALGYICSSAEKGLERAISELSAVKTNMAISMHENAIRNKGVADGDTTLAQLRESVCIIESLIGERNAEDLHKLLPIMRKNLEDALYERMGQLMAAGCPMIKDPVKGIKAEWLDVKAKIANWHIFLGEYADKKAAEERREWEARMGSSDSSPMPCLGFAM
jgi:hypothetical protein